MTKTPSQDAELQELYDKYWTYVYKYLLDDPKGYDPKNYSAGTDLQSFKQQLDDEAHRIKVVEGY